MENENGPKYITEDQLKEYINNIDNNVKETIKTIEVKDYSKDIDGLKTEIKSMKRQLRDLNDEIKEG